MGTKERLSAQLQEALAAKGASLIADKPPPEVDRKPAHTPPPPQAGEPDRRFVDPPIAAEKTRRRVMEPPLLRGRVVLVRPEVQLESESEPEPSVVIEEAPVAKRQRRSHDEQAKRDAAALVLDSGKKQAEVAAKYGVTASSVSLWVKQEAERRAAGGAAARKPSAQKGKPVETGEPVRLVVRIDGLEEYVQKLVDRKVAERFKRALTEL